MGFFSWNCKACGHPILSHYVINRTNSWMNDVVVLLPDGTRLFGEYDGYGSVNNLDIGINPCCYHESCWVKAKKPKFDGPSRPAFDQGWFFDEGDYDIPNPLGEPEEETPKKE